MQLKKIQIIFFFLCPVFLSGCQTQDLNDPNKLEGNAELKVGDGTLDLSQFSLEQQKKEREEAAKKRIELKEKRVILELEDKEKNIKTIPVFLRPTTKHPIKDNGKIISLF